VPNVVLYFFFFYFILPPKVFPWKKPTSLYYVTLVKGWLAVNSVIGKYMYLGNDHISEESNSQPEVRI